MKGATYNPNVWNFHINRHDQEDSLQKEIEIRLSQRWVDGFPWQPSGVPQIHGGVLNLALASRGDKCRYSHGDREKLQYCRSPPSPGWRTIFVWASKINIAKKVVECLLFFWLLEVILIHFRKLKSNLGVYIPIKVLFGICWYLNSGKLITSIL